MDYLKLILNKSKWTTLSAVLLVLTQLVIYLFIVRYVAPKDLGYYATASSIVIILIGLIDFSFSSSLIHETNPKATDYRSVFSINIYTALIGFVVGVFIALLLSKVYGSNIIIWMVLGVSPALFLNTYITVHAAGLKKDLLFNKLAKYEMVGTVMSFIVFILCLYGDMGIWSLVFATVARYLFIALSYLWGKHSYFSLSTKYDPPTLQKHFNYGKYILGEKGLSSLLSYLDVYLVGSFLGMTTLGIYDVLKKIVLRPLLLVYNAVENVVFPLLSNSKDKLPVYKNVYEQFLSISSFFFIPAFLVLFVFADIFIDVLPDTYLPHDNVLRAICVLGISIVIFNPTDILLYSKGRTRLFLKWMLGYTIPFCLILFFAVQENLTFFIYAMAFCYMLLYAVAYFVLFKSEKSIGIETYFKPLAFGVVAIFTIKIIIENLGGAGRILSTVLILTLSVLFYVSGKKKKTIIADPY